MKLFVDLRKWIGSALKKLYPIDLSVDALTAIQQEAINRNRIASEENYLAARSASDAISELMAQMEAKRNA